MMRSGQRRCNCFIAHGEGLVGPVGPVEPVEPVGPVVIEGPLGPAEPPGPPGPTWAKIAVGSPTDAALIETTTAAPIAKRARAPGEAPCSHACTD